MVSASEEATISDVPKIRESQPIVNLIETKRRSLKSGCTLMYRLSMIMLTVYRRKMCKAMSFPAYLTLVGTKVSFTDPNSVAKEEHKDS